ncbi:MAG: hypothetical protein HC877_18685 [Thioploca sp.]|nr:hypothetical protein [Thioploca sp.]
MSNFIDRLINQHRELLPLIQPRQPSRFEPPSVVDSNGLGHSGWRKQPDMEFHTSEVNVQPFLAETAAAIQSTRSTMRSQQKSQLSPSPTAGALNMRTSPLTDHTPESLYEVNPPNQAEPSQSHDPVELGQLRYQSPISDELKVYPPNTSTTYSPKVKVQIADNEPKLSAIDSVPRTYQSTQFSQEPGVQVNPPVDQPTISGMKQVILSEKTRVTNNSPVIYQEGYLSPPCRILEQTEYSSGSRPTSTAPDQSAIKADPLPSTIQVSIGRIEIKAIPTPLQPQTTRAKQPTMSLDEYLHRRNGGGNR